jgi:hypothetical protein
VVGERWHRPAQGRAQTLEENAHAPRTGGHRSEEGGSARHKRAHRRPAAGIRGRRTSDGARVRRKRRGDLGVHHQIGPAVTSARQWAANRENAQKRTGPRTDEGKRRSRRNALRHGLTTETVVEGLEDTEDYRAFEATIIADYDAHTAVERELVLRLASLLWRIRRATGIETDLLRIQADIICARTKGAGGAASSSPNAAQPAPLGLPRLGNRVLRSVGDAAPEDAEASPHKSNRECQAGNRRRSCLKRRGS